MKNFYYLFISGSLFLMGCSKDDDTNGEKPKSNTIAMFANPNNFEVLSCDDRSSRQSSPGAAVTIYMANQHDQDTLHVYWVDFAGNETRYSDNLHPGRIREQPTFATHPWVITRKNGECVGMVVTKASANNDTIYFR
jgi:hypothetical protein